jgi:small subunit ribosomal protein S21
MVQGKHGTWTPETDAKGVKKEMTDVKCRKGEPIERALRRLKKKMDKEGTLKELRNRRHYEKPSEVKRRESRHH